MCYIKTTFTLDAEIKRLTALNKKLVADLTQAQGRNLESDAILEDYKLLRERFRNHESILEETRRLKTKNDDLLNKVVRLDIQHEMEGGTSGASYEKDRLKRELEEAQKLGEEVAELRNELAEAADELVKLKAECGGRDQGKFIEYKFMTTKK